MDKFSANGFLLIDKPAGITSFDVIRHLRKSTGIRTFGHAGTLDPFATGLLILATGNYTRLLSLLDNHDKTYLASISLGTETTTGDPEGEVLQRVEYRKDDEKLNCLEHHALRINKLKPHKFSAVKINGIKAYKKSRQNEDFELPERNVVIHEFKLLDCGNAHLSYSCRVSKGTYVRCLSIWIAEFLGTVGFTKTLRRTAIGGINVDRALSPEEIRAETIQNQLISAQDMFPDLEMVTLSDSKLKAVKQGQCIESRGNDTEPVLMFGNDGQCRGIAYRQGNKLYPKVNI